MRLLPISLDPPEHGKYRRLLNRPFSPPNMEALSDQIEARCNALIDSVIDQGGCEFIDAFGKPLPTGIFCDMLGLPQEEVKKFLEWNYVILHVHGDEAGQARQRKANEELTAYLRDLVFSRTTDPRGDLISQMIPLEVDGHSMTADETLATAYLLFMAGLDTVTAGLGWCWNFFAENPVHRQQLIDDPALIPNAVEELLRYFAFVEDSRTLTRDAEFAGVQMKAGERIMLPTSSACRDEEEFPNALTVDFHREPNRHIAFAAGPHRCLGSHLARVEMRIAMTVWHQRIPHYRIREGAKASFHGGAVVGPDTVPLEFLSA